MLRSEYRVIVLWIDTGIVTIPLFKVDVPSSSECIGFGSEFSRMETDYEIESGKVFGPTCLSMREDFGHCKILQVPVIGDHVNWKSRAFEVMSPLFESFKNCKELFVMDIVVQFQSGKGPGVECNGVQFAI